MDKPIKFENRNLAESFINRATVVYMIVLGDDQKFWVVTPVNAERLIKAQYEAA